MTPRAAYARLRAAYGPRGWWPLTPRGGERPRYRPGRYAAPGRRGAEEMCLGAILTQNTVWGNVERALGALACSGALGLREAAALPARRLERLIRPSGYFRQKAKKIKAFAAWAAARGFGPRLLRGAPLADLRAELLAVFGVGPETADSILLYAGGRRIFVVDAYTKRIGARLGFYPAHAGYAEVQAYWTRRLPRSAQVYNECHALLVELAKRACAVKPRCGQCPLKAGCPTGRQK